MTITHDPNAQRFSITIDGHSAFLTYQILDDETLLYDHTIVPDELGGQGIGAQLATFALNYAQNMHKKVIPACPFIARFTQKHPEYADLLVE